MKLFDRLFRAEIVYTTKNRQDWEKAKASLLNAKIEFKSWETEEQPVGG